ncbi:MAG: PaaI family thioesterase [Deferrisomatales bacterium]
MNDPGSAWEALRDPDAAEPQFEMAGWVALAPFERLCDMELVEACDGRCRLRMPFKVKHAQGGGLMHGGALTALADTAVALAVKTRVAPGTTFVTRELSCRFHAPVRRGMVEARARIVRFEGRDVDARAEVLDGDGRLVVSFSAQFRVLRDDGAPPDPRRWAGRERVPPGGR